MKKRKRLQRQQVKRNASSWLGSLTKASKQTRRPWTFERLEDRHLMSANTLSNTAVPEIVMISSDTPEGQQLLRWLELDAAERASGGSGLGSLKTLDLPTDPNLLEQWHLINVGQITNLSSTLQNIYGTPGQDINVLPAWDRGLTGNGIIVAVVDTGVQSNHPDLAANLGLQYAFNAITGAPNGNPVGNTPDAAHGTAVAGLIGADSNNRGGTGVAFGSTIVPIKFLSTGLFEAPPTEQSYIDMFLGNGAPIDIFNHSWKAFDPENPRGVLGPSPAVLDALIQSVQTGRNGLGAIHVFAAGNDAGPAFTPGFEDVGILASMGTNGYASSRYVISVGMIDHNRGEFESSIINDDGTLTAYGEAGTALLVVAPSASGRFDIGYNQNFGSGIFTTDLTNGGINIPPLPNGTSQDVDLFPNTDYTSRFGGTSAAAPLVSGVIALMLEADKLANGGVATLTYRDVQEILVRSAKQVDPNDLSWVVNPTPFFFDALPADAPQWEVGVDDEGEPIAVRIPDDVDYNPALFPHPYTIAAPLPTNGAGYTVSHGWMADFANQYGFGHGMIDADLAVRLASQWNLKDQSLAPQKTFGALFVNGYYVQPYKVIPGTEANGDEVFIPGGLVLPGAAPEDFTAYFQEFFKVPDLIEGDEGDPDAMPPVPPTPPMIDPDTLPFMGEDPPGNSRGSYITVTGPSDMSVEWVELKMDIPYADANKLDNLRITLVSPDGTHSELNHYQYQGGIIGANNQYVRGTLAYPYDEISFIRLEDPVGTLDSDLDGNSVFSWTFSSNRHWGERSDGEWRIYMENYSDELFELGNMQMVWHGQDVGPSDRMLGFVDNTGGYLGHGSDATVYIKDSAGNRVAQFVTGADGNYYFDVGAFTNYTLGIDVPAGHKLIGMQEVPLTDGHRFQLEPLVPQETAVNFTGQVFADLNGNGLQDLTDAGVKNFVVYLDENHNGQFESGEPNDLTDDDGSYSIPYNVAASTLITVGIKPPAGWQVTEPTSGFVGKLASPNSTEPIVANFGVKPPSSPTGQGPSTIYGLVFNDSNGSGVQEAHEVGIQDLIVYLDDGDGVFDPNADIYTTTTAGGAFVFNDIDPGTVTVRVNVDSAAFQLTVPATGEAEVTVVAGQVLQGVLFGIRDLRTHDFGDLVGVGFRSSAAEDGPRHFVVPGFSLGTHVDAEVSAKIDPSEDGLGDDNSGGNDVNPIDDEDGVVIVGGFLRPGVNLLQVLLQGEGGYLQGWFDFNNNGTFEASEQVFINEDLTSGAHNLPVTAPSNLAPGVMVAARFRWGTLGKTWFGSDIIGEVEDYLFETKAAALPGDYNLDDVVNATDYNIWKSTFGSTTDLRADGNKNGIVDLADYSVWRNAKDNPGSGGGSAALAGMAPPLPASSAAGTPTMLSQVGSALPALGTATEGAGVAESLVESAGGGAGQYQSSTSHSLANDGDSAAVAALHFTTSFSPAHDLTPTLSQSVAGESSDLAILLLSAGYGQGQRVESSSAFDDADDDLLSSDGERDGEIDLAIAAVFEDERDWRLAL